MLKEFPCLTRPHRLSRLADRLYERLAATLPGPSLSHYSLQCVEGKVCEGELRVYGVLRSSPCTAQEATQYALVIATIVRRCDHVALKLHRGPPTLPHSDVEGYPGTMER